MILFELDFSTPTPYCAVKKAVTKVFVKFFEVFASFSRLSDVFGAIRIHLDPLGCIRTHSEAFGSVWTENF